MGEEDQAILYFVSRSSEIRPYCILDFSLSQKNSWSLNDTCTYSVHMFTCMYVTRTELHVIANVRGLNFRGYNKDNHKNLTPTKITRYTVLDIESKGTV